MKRFGVFIAAAAVVALAASDVSAQGKAGSARGAGSVNAGGGKGNGATKTTTGGPQVDAPKGPKAVSPAAGGGSPKADVTSAATATVSSPGQGNGGAASGNARANRPAAPTASTTTTTATATPTTTTTTTTTGTGTVALPNRVSTRIAGNPQQKARIEAMLPVGMTLEQATTGFRNQGQFMAALNASKNQGVDFAQLQTAMTVDGLSLGQAVKQLRNAPPAATSTTTGTTTTGTTTTGTTPTGTTTTGTTTTGTTTTGTASGTTAATPAS